jgi:hypothetical protein
MNLLLKRRLLGSRDAPLWDRDGREADLARRRPASAPGALRNSSYMWRAITARSQAEPKLSFGACISELLLNSTVGANQKHATATKDVLAAAVVGPFVLQTAARELHPLHAAAVEELERVLADAAKDGPVTNVA